MNSTRFNREEWESIRADCEAQIELLSGGFMDRCRTVIAEKMSGESAMLSRLGIKESELYTNCVKLMLAYREAISLYERFQSDIISTEAAEIISGIITVLVSRLREFEESGTSGNNVNPITEERQTIVKDALDNMKMKISEKWDCGKVYSKQALLTVVREKILPALYEDYIDILHTCKGRLDDLNERREMQFYLTLMEDEWEILSTIIKIQVRALEQVVEHAANALEKIAIHKFFSILREAYQHFGKASTEISAVFYHSDDIIEERKPQSYHDFESYVITRLDIPDAEVFAFWYKLSDAELKADVFRKNVIQEASAIFGRFKMDFLKSIYSFRRLISDEMMLASEMIRIFDELYTTWPSAGTNDLYSEIIRGVGETIEIKIDSLKENTEVMKTECTSMVDTIQAENIPNITPDEIETENAKEAVWQLWLENPENFEASCEELPIFYKRKEINCRKITDMNEKLEKRLLKFKRDILLYEISTFEEIIFYSISRLREDEKYLHAAELADDTLYKLEVLLKKNNIDVIRPKPHERFNPKEHEVLMAEPNPEFKKGEIVKLMNSGYRQNDVILLRANVIAAR